jgi:hypothetical protein
VAPALDAEARPQREGGKEACMAAATSSYHVLARLLILRKMEVAIFPYAADLCSERSSV